MGSNVWDSLYVTDYRRSYQGGVIFMGFKIWLLILNLVAFMSCLAYSTAKDDRYRDAWVVVIGFASVITVFSIICSFFPVS